MRGFFRIHLSTALILMLTAAVLLKLNVNPRKVTFDSTTYNLSATQGEIRHVHVHRTGFPYPIEGWLTSVSASQTPQQILNADYGPFNPEYEYVKWNVITCASILLAVAIVCEWVLRRGKAFWNELKERMLALFPEFFK